MIKRENNIEKKEKREILFKAKRKDNGEWVEGYYAKLGYGNNTKHFIIQNVSLQEDISYFEDIEIDIDTLCQYTGLTDKSGNRIWENDIVELPDENVYFKCEWEKDTARFVLNGDRFTVDFDDYREYEVEVIGNIFDNTDLLEVER